MSKLKKYLFQFRQLILWFILDPYFCFWGRLYLNRWRPIVIVVTGSVGKTNLLHLLKEQFGSRAYYSYRSNTKVGITLNLFDLPDMRGQRWRWLTSLFKVPYKALTAPKKPQKFYLVEYDVYDVSSSRWFKKWLRPNLCLWTTISPSHLENFDRLAKRTQRDVLDVLTDHFAQIAKSAEEYIFALATNKLMRQGLKNAQTPIKWLEDDLVDYRLDLQKTIFQFKKVTFKFGQPMPRAFGQSLLYCRALSEYYQLPLKTDFSDWYPPPGRSTLLRGYKNCFLLDSSYNAQPEAMWAIIKMFKKLQAKSKWFVCGDMIEQGLHTQKCHQQLVEAILDLNPKRVYLVGPRVKKYTYPQLKTRHRQVHWVSKIDRVFVDQFKANIQGGEVILFKGAGFLDILVQALLLDPADSQFLNNPRDLTDFYNSKDKL